MKNKNLLYGVLFVAVVVAAVGVLVYSRAEDDSSTQEFAVNNTVPTIDNVWVSIETGQSGNSMFDLAANAGTTAAWVSGTATDANGCAEIDDADDNSWTAKFYEDGTVNSDCSADTDDCYILTPVDLNITGCDNSSDTDLRFDFTTDLQYYALPSSTWKAQVGVTDDQAASQTAYSDNITVTTHRDLSATDTISFPNAGVGGTSTTSFTITNLSNTAIDFSFASVDANMDCAAATSADIPLTNIAYSTASIDAVADGTALSVDSQEFGGFDLARRDSAGASSATIYAALLVPNGAHGSCSNTVNFTAADPS